MSIKAMSWVFDLELPPTPKLVLLVLADHADDQGFCFPGTATISRRASVSERTLTRVLAKLEEQGYIARSRRHLANGNRTSDGYLLTPDQATEWRLDQPPSEHDQPPAVASTGEPSVEPSVKKKAAHRLPDNWEPSNAHRLQAQMRGVDADYEAAKFRDWCLSNDARKSDWEATFRNWIRNARPEPGMGTQRQRPGNAPPRTPADRMNAVLAIQDPNQMGMIE